MAMARKEVATIMTVLNERKKSNGKSLETEGKTN
jgi:ribosomal protein L29